jgi:hypothetical protein
MACRDTGGGGGGGGDGDDDLGFCLDSLRKTRLFSAIEMYDDL